MNASAALTEGARPIHWAAVIGVLLGAGVIAICAACCAARGVSMLWCWVRKVAVAAEAEGQPPPVTNAVQLLLDPAEAMNIAGVLSVRWEELNKLVAGPLAAVPYSVGSLYCPRCLAALLVVDGSANMVKYVSKVEGDRTCICLDWSANSAHKRCPFDPEIGDSVPSKEFMLMAYHIRQFVEWLRKRSAAQQARAAEGQTLPQLEAPGRGKRKEATRVQSGGDDPNPKAYDARLRWEDLQAQMRRIEDARADAEYYGTRADHGDVANGEATAADRWDEDEVDQEEFELQAEMDKLERQFGHHWRQEGPREEYNELCKAKRAANHIDNQLSALTVSETAKRAHCEEAWSNELYNNLTQWQLQAEKLERQGLMDCGKRGLAACRRCQRCEFDMIECAAMSPPPFPRLEGAPEVVATDDQQLFYLPTAEQMEQFVQRMQTASDDAVQRHREVYRVLNPIEYEPVAEAASSSNALTGRQKSEAKREKKLKARLESVINGTAKMQLGLNAASITCGPGDTRGAVVFPDNTCITFLTHRHRYVDGVAVDSVVPVGTELMAQLWIDGASVARTAVVQAVRCPPGKDQQFLYTDLSAAGIESTVVGPPQVGGPAVITTARVGTRPTGVWSLSPGVIKGVDSKYVYYTMSTEDGDCGYPVYQNGKVVATHRWGEVTMNDGTRANAGEAIVVPPRPKKGVCDAPPYTPTPFTEGARMQGKVVEAGVLRSIYLADKRRRTERFKSFPLRNINLRGLIPRHHVAKPSTAMGHREVQKFGDAVECQFDSALFAKAVQAAILYDCYDPIMTPFVPPTHAAVLEAINVADLQRSAGYTAEALTAEQYITVLGNGNLEAGKVVLADRVMRLWNVVSRRGIGPIIDASPVDDPELRNDYQLMVDCGVWNVITKNDGYKEKKLPLPGVDGTGRTIQAPSLELKLLWIATFGENDDAWMHRSREERTSWVHAGENADKPCDWHTVEAIRKSWGAIAGDLTAFDRYQSAEMLKAFFMQYLPAVCPGAPMEYLSWLASVTIQGPLLMSDGVMYFRERGLPSGFMNTLRLNCFVHLCCLCYVVMRRLGWRTPVEVAQFLRDDVLVSMCGDDSRHLALTARAAVVFDLFHDGEAYLSIWRKELPWEMKLEGCCAFAPDTPFATKLRQMPPMVSRRYLQMDGYVFEAPYDVSRCLRRLACEQRRDDELEKAIVRSAFDTLALPIYWQSRGLFYSSALEFLMREFLTPALLRAAVDKAAAMYGYAPRQHAPVGQAGREVRLAWS